MKFQKQLDGTWSPVDNSHPIKLSIESWLNKGETNHAQDEALDYIFLNILEAIRTSKDETQLREQMKSTWRFCTCNNYTAEDLFSYGFGGSHMWVIQTFKTEDPKRLIFVEF